jgi:hypothetical protein
MSSRPSGVGPTNRYTFAIGNWLILAKNAIEGQPGQGGCGTAGVGSGEHVSAILFQNVTGTPYRGGAPVVQDLIVGGRSIS